MTMPIGEAFVVIRPVMTGFSTAVRGEVAASVAGSTAALSGMSRTVGAATAGVATRSAGIMSRVGSSVGGLSSRVGSSIQSMAGRSQGMIGGIGASLKSMAAFAAPLLAVIGLKSIFTKGIAGAREENKVLASISQTIKTTGDASHMTRGSIDKLAGSLSNQTGKVKATILGGESMLLMFKNVRNEVGKGNDIFTQTTKLSLDLSAKMGTTVPGAAKLLGKALQDPLKGMSALRRANIILTSAQQDSIKKFMAHGKIMDAQRVILGAVSSAVGGQARAQSTAADRMKVAWGNFTTEIGQKVIPIVNKIESFISEKVIPTLIKWFHQILAGQGVWGSIERAIKSFIKVVQDVIKWMQAHETIVKSVAVGLLAFWAAWKGFTIIAKVMVSFQKLTAVMKANPIILIISIIIALVAAFIYAYKHSETFRNIVNGVWKSISDFFIKVWKSYLKPVFDALVTAWRNTWAFLQRAWVSVGRPIFNVIVTIVKIMWKAIEIIFQALLTIWKILWGAIKLAWNYIGKPIFFIISTYIKVWWAVLKFVFNTLITVWKALWAGIKAAWNFAAPIFAVIGKVIYAIIGGVILLAIQAVKFAWNVLWTTVKSVWTKFGHPVFDAISTVVSWLWKKVIVPVFKIIQLLWNNMWAIFRSIWNNIGKPIFNAISSIISWLWKKVAVPVFGFIKGLWSGLWSGISAVWTKIGKPVFDVVSTVIHGIWNTVSKVFGWITTAWSTLWGGFSKVFSTLWSGVKSAIETGVNFIITIVNGLISGINWILNKLPGGFSIDPVPYVGERGKTKNTFGNKAYPGAYAEGGVFPGYSPGHDNISIGKYKFSGGEGILTPETTRAIGGARGIDKLNRRFTKRMIGSSDGEHFKGGGIWSDIWGGLTGSTKGLTGGPANLVSDIRKGSASALRAALNLAEIPIKGIIKILPEALKKLTQGEFSKIDETVRGMINDLGGQARAAAAAAAGAPIPVGQHLALIKKALGYTTAGDTPGNEADVNMIVNFESGWNASAVNRVDSNAQAGHPSTGLMQCVSLSTTILTRRGWLTHDQVVVGDETIGYNPATGRSEWTTITKVVHYENAPVWRIGHRNWHADVTPNHRWWSDSNGGEFVRTEDFASHHRIRLAAPTDIIGIDQMSMEDLHVAPSTFHEPEVLPQQTVWCVSTPLQTWTARLDGQIFLTGNTIIGTFEAYRDRTLPDSMTDPLSNLVAGINYAMSRYGSLDNVPGVQAVHAGGKYVGYSSGAWKVNSDQIAKIHKDEMILPKETADNVRSGGGGGSMMNEAEMVAAFAKALSGMAIRFDGDGLARLVTKHQSIYAVKGVHR